MAVIRTDDFERALKRFSKEIREIAEKQYSILEIDSRDPRLHIKKLKKPYKGIYSFRITRNYRALFYFDRENNIIVFDADNRKDIYR